MFLVEPSVWIGSVFRGVHILLDFLYRRRPSSGVAHPRGGDDPYLSSNNEHILDIKFGEFIGSLLGYEHCRLWHMPALVVLLACCRNENGTMQRAVVAMKYRLPAPCNSRRLAL